MTVIGELLAEATTTKNTAMLKQLRATLDDYWRYHQKAR